MPKITTCLKCGKTDIKNIRQHILVEENMSIEEYVIQFVHGGVKPKCICGKELEFVSNKFRFKIACCNAHVNIGRKHTDEYKTKMKEKVKEIMGRPEHRQRSSENLKKRWENGEIDKLFNIDREKIKQKERMREESATERCEECGKLFELISQHIRFCSVHPMSYPEYLVKHKYGGIHPKCICGKETNYRSAIRDFASCCDGHQFLGRFHSDGSKQQIYKSYSGTMQGKYGVTNGFQLPGIQQKSRETSLQKYGFEYHQQNEQQKLKIPTLGVFATNEYRSLHDCGQPSKIETAICEKLGAIGGFVVSGKEYDMIINDILIEVDNKFYHPPKIENLTMIQLNDIVNDKQKLEIAKNHGYKLCRIYTDNIPNEITVDTICANAYVPDYNFENNTIIMSRKYLESRLAEDKTYNDTKIILKFIKLFRSNMNVTFGVLYDFLISGCSFTIDNLAFFISNKQNE